MCSCSVWTPLQLKSTSGIHISYENRPTTATEIYFRRPHFIWVPPSCFAGHSINQRVRFAGSRGPVKPAFCQSMRGKIVIPEQFTLKTHPVSVGWRRGVNNGARYYSSLQLTLTFKTHTKHAKMHEMYKLFIFAAVLSAAAKLQRLAICIIYKFKYKNSNTHTSMEAPPRPDMFGGGGESFKMAALLAEWCETTSDRATTADTCHVLHLHANTMCSTRAHL